MAQSDLQKRCEGYKPLRIVFDDTGSVGRDLRDLKHFDNAIASYLASTEVVTAQRQARDRSIQQSLWILLAVLIFGAFYFANVCQWPWYTGLYFSWITLSTIGFGDYSPMNRCGDNSYFNVSNPQVVRVWIVFVCVGVASISYVLATLTQHTYSEPRETLAPKKCRKLTKGCIDFAKLVVVFIVGALLFVVSEGWSYTDGFYFGITTLLTIGYGDYGGFYQAVKDGVNATEETCMRYGECSFDGITDVNASCYDCVLSPGGKLTVIIYSLCGLIFIGGVFGKLTSLFSEFRRKIEVMLLRAMSKKGAKRGHHKDEPSNSAEEHEVPSDAELNERLDRRYCACDQVFCIRFILLIFFGLVFLLVMYIFGVVSNALENRGVGNASESWSGQDTFYYAVVTGTTIGYGDFTPTTSGARIWLICFGLPMLAVVAFYIEQWVDSFGLIEATIREAYNKQRKHPKHKTSENCAKVESSFFTFGLFLLVVTMVLLVNIGFVWALVIDGLSDSDVEIGAADGEIQLLTILYFVTFTYLTIGYGDQPGITRATQNYISWLAVINLAVYAYFFVFVSHTLEEWIRKSALRHAQNAQTLSLTKDVLEAHGIRHENATADNDSGDNDDTESAEVELTQLTSIASSEETVYPEDQA